ncbi:hypothetical protein D9M71_365820 [compost metagenome]
MALLPHQDELLTTDWTWARTSGPSTYTGGFCVRHSGGAQDAPAVLVRVVKSSVVKNASAFPVFCADTLKVTERSSEPAGTKSMRAEVMVAPWGMATVWKRKPVVRALSSFSL